MSNWRVKKGNTSVQDVPVYDRNGDLITNLADAEHIKFQVKENPKDATPKIEKTKEEGGGIQVNIPSSGYLRITLSPSDTLIEAAKYYMALEIKWDADTLYETRLYIQHAETSEFEIEEDIIHP